MPAGGRRLRFSAVLLLAPLLAAENGSNTSSVNCTDPEKEYEQFEEEFSKASFAPQDLGRGDKDRFDVFKENLKVIDTLSAEDRSATFGVTQFAGMTAQQFASDVLCTNCKPDLDNLDFAFPSSSPLKDLGSYHLPKEKNWQREGFVRPAGNQGYCGDCWAFAISGAIQSAWAIATGELVALSQQQFVDCYAKSCSGQQMGPVYWYAMTHHLFSLASYPYTSGSTGQAGTCVEHSAASSPGPAIPSGGVNQWYLVRDNTELLREAVALTPVAAFVNANPLQFYKGGVLTGKTCGDGDVNHVVLIIGYGRDEASGLDYWLVQNSWGEHWGEHGNFRLERGGNWTHGACGIEIWPGYPTVQTQQSTPRLTRLYVAAVAHLPASAGGFSAVAIVMITCAALAAIIRRSRGVAVPVSDGCDEGLL